MLLMNNGHKDRLPASRYYAKASSGPELGNCEEVQDRFQFILGTRIPRLDNPVSCSRPPAERILGLGYTRECDMANAGG
jgi:hypothetical protein